METEQVLARLRGLGRRLTRQRYLVVEALLAGERPQSAEGIYQRCREKDRGISYPTIYRTLEMLVEAEVVRKLHFGGSKYWYEAAWQREHHHHLVCLECGAKEPIMVCPRELIAREAQRNQFKVLDHQFEILGICKDCQGR